MNYLMAFIVFVVCAFTYYEHTQKLESDLTYNQQIGDLTDKVAKLEAENKQLQDDKDKLNKSVADEKTQLDTMAATAQAAQKAAEEAKKEAAAPPPPPLPEAPPIISSLDGKTYQNCKIVKVEPDGITFNHSLGTSKVPFTLLSPDLQKRYGYDPDKPLGAVTGN